LITGLVIYFIFGIRWINFLRSKQYGQVIRDDGPQSHLQKKDTPTMGGILIIGSVLVSALLWCDLTNVYIWVALLVMPLEPFNKRTTSFLPSNFTKEAAKLL